MRKSPRPLFGLLATVCVCVSVGGCGVSTRGAESQVRTVVLSVPTVSSPGASRLAQRPVGEILVAGSVPGSLTALAARAYRSAGGSDTVAIKDAAANVAFSQLCGGQIDLVDSSRPISSTELAQCVRAGIRPVQLEVASDAIVLATKAQTDVGADCLTVAEVKAIFRAGSPVYNWGQLGFDQVPLAVAGPGPEDLGFGFFSQDVLGSSQPSLLDFRSDYHAEGSDQQALQFVTGSAADTGAAAGVTQLQQSISTLNAIFAGARKTLTGANAYVSEASAQVTKGIVDRRPLAAEQHDAATLADAKTKQMRAQHAVLNLSSQLASAQRGLGAARAAQGRLASDVGHLGMFGFAYYGLYEESLRPLEVTASASAENCIFPSQETVTSAAYPLSRQLLITTSLQDLKRPDVREFLLSYLHNAQRLATQQGLVELPDDVLGREQAYLGTAAQPITASSAWRVSGTGTLAASAADLPESVH